MQQALRRYAEAKAFAGPGSALSLGSRIRVRGIKTLGAAKNPAGIFDVEPENGDAIQSSAGRNDARSAERSSSWFQSNQRVECSRHSAGARCVGAEREGDKSRGDGNSRPGTRSAGNETLVEDA